MLGATDATVHGQSSMNMPNDKSPERKNVADEVTASEKEIMRINVTASVSNHEQAWNENIRWESSPREARPT